MRIRALDNLEFGLPRVDAGDETEVSHNVGKALIHANIAELAAARLSETTTATSAAYPVREDLKQGTSDGE